MIHRLPWLIPLSFIALAVWWWSGLRQEAATLSQQRAVIRPVITTKASLLPSTGDPTPLTATLQAIATEREQVASIKREADALAARIPVTQADEIITSYGKIEDMGHETGDTLKFFVMLDTLAKDPSDASSRTMDSTIHRMLLLQGRLPEIRAFESHPDEIARFQSKALQQAVGLKPGDAATTHALVRAAFTDIATRHLTGNERPAPDNDAAWKQQRTEVLQRLMQQLRPMLPEKGSTYREKFALMLVLNLGAGFDQDMKSEAGKETISWGMKWPTVPW